MPSQPCSRYSGAAREYTSGDRSPRSFSFRSSWVEKGRQCCAAPAALLLLGDEVLDADFGSLVGVARLDDDLVQLPVGEAFL